MKVHEPEGTIQRAAGFDNMHEALAWAVQWFDRYGWDDEGFWCASLEVKASLRWAGDAPPDTPGEVVWSASVCGPMPAEMRAEDPMGEIGGGADV